ncbi:MAG: hypothetical protein ABGZ23_17210 [Fuerstiella sp.]
MSKLLIRIVLVCCVLATSDFCSKACCQDFREPGFGRRSRVNVVIPGPMTSSQRIGVPVYSNSQYSVSQIDASGHAMVRTYSSRPQGAQYSMQPVDNYGSHHYGNSHLGTHQYNPPGTQYPGHVRPPTLIHIYGRPPIPISPGFGHGYSGSIAPRPGLPYGSPGGVTAAVPALPSYPAVPLMPENGAARSPVRSLDERPIVGEFPINTPAGEQPPTRAIDLIRSLRHQTSGDIAFRRQDYASAEVFFETATETAPSRRAPWLRLAWTQLARQRFSDAAANLKTALQLNDEPTTSWVSGGLLFGDSLHTSANLENEQLWNWLQERPGSTDRLLLTAAFQHLRGDSGIARELLAVASQNGLPDTLHRAMQEIVNNIHHNAERDHQPPFATPPTTIDSTPNTYVPRLDSGEDSIPFQQRHIAPVNPDALSLPDAGGAEALEAIDLDRPAVPPIPQNTKPAPERSGSLPADLPGLSRKSPISV